MFGSVILDVAVGLILTYLLFSLVSTSLREWLAAVLKTRSTTLEKGMCELLGEGALVADFYNHPLINSLYRGGDYLTAKKKRQLPSYIPSKSFSTALLDMIVRGRDSGTGQQSGSESRVVTIESVRAQISRIENPRVQRAVLMAIDSANGDLAVAQANLEHWFDSTMDRVSGWYKSHSQIYVFCIGLALVIFADANTFTIAQRLYTDPVQRQTAVAMAGNMSVRDTGGDSVLTHTRANLERLGLPLVGWQQVVVADSLPLDAKARIYGDHALSALMGWLITAFAISLGAPFWFDTLGRIMVIRNTVKPNQKSPNEASDDRQNAGGPPRPPTPPPPGPALPAPTAPLPGAQAVPLLQGAATPAPTGATASSARASEEFQAHEWASGSADQGAL